MPAIDILQLEKNESTAYAENIALLFAASGDLRNVVKTIADLPTEFNHQLHVTINDREFEVVARNIILLLFALASLEDLSSTSPDHQAVTVQIAEILIHVWYSVFLPNAMLSQIQRNVKPLISQVCAKIIGKTPDSVLGKTWTFTSPGSTIRLVLRQKEWLRLEKCLDIPQSLTRGKARDIRAATMMAPERQDFRDRWYYKDATPFMRIAKQRFREDGLLLPFGHPTHVRGSIFPIRKSSSKSRPRLPASLPIHVSNRIGKLVAQLNAVPFSKHPTPGLQRTKQIH